MSKATNKTQTITLTIAGNDMAFEPPTAAYYDAQTEVAKGNIGDAAHNFCFETVVEADKAALRDLNGQNPGAVLQLFGLLSQQYAPQIEITVKK